jgi:2-keto-3-deoxy-galactonokinase
MNAEETNELYQQLIEKLGREVTTFPHNYSLSDGLLYLAHHQRNSLSERLLTLA